MGEFEFKGDVDSLSSRQRKFIREVLVKRRHENSKVTVESVGKAGDNYMANVKRITAKSSDGEILKMIVKVAPTNEIARQRTRIDLSFKNEAIAYEEILPKFVELQVAAGMNKEKLYRFPECYGALLEEPNELIILEDLQPSKFVLLDRFKPLTDNVVRMILKKFALLHSLSIIWKKQDPETFSKFKTTLFDAFGSFNELDEFVMLAKGTEDDTISILKDEKYKNAVRNTASMLFQDWKVICEDQADLTQSVAIHGDAWTNNIMFRLEDGEPVDCILIDYQLVKISSPACDILYMIFNCTDHETRCKHYYDWIQYYHDELDKSLSNFGIKVDSVYPKYQLRADLKKYSKLYLGLCILLGSLLIRKSDDAAKVKQAMESDLNVEDVIKSFQTSDLDNDSIALFKDRIEGIVDSYLKFGYIDEI